MSRERNRSARPVVGSTGRRSIRLGGYDYSHSGAYFVTVCAVRRGLLFGWISDGSVAENGNASIVRDCWLDLPNHYPHVSLDAFAVMPEHIHGIVVLLDTFEVDGVRTERADLKSQAGNAWAGLKPA